MHLHLDVSGGLTGNTFIAAVLDAFPRFEPRVIVAIDSFDAAYPVICTLAAHAGGELSGHRFEIEPFVKYFGHIPVAFPREPTRWESVRKQLSAAQIGSRIRTHAIKIFELMVSAEAAVQNVAPDRVLFEPGAWNSLAQVVGAATLIDALDTARWSASGLASGGAVSRIGAAIVDYLSQPRARGEPLPKGRSLVRNGTGFGSSSAPDCCTRLLCFETRETSILEQNAPPAQRRPAVRSAQRTRQ